MANTGHSTPSVPIKSPADTNSNFVASPSSFAHKSDINNSSVQSRSTETTGSNSLSAPPSAFVSTSPSAFDSPSKNTASQFKTSSSNHEKDASASSTTSSSGSANSAGGPMRHKTKLLTKLRGEAKIFSGKLSGKEEKVEEGRRIVRGEL
ncbi:hypothetical protein BDP27DRAFT_23091 [Rhodocollybia butyracea]|uniref:Uncharacterized protein n=1 Tax=Rhodocollybia butyracea TaxID=206335 RepID=A0A9P5UGM9_9AGAR|nr:hypothetical protein BDP27DRAFT_23091 [Rhodocollybia butyracea]